MNPKQPLNHCHNQPDNESYEEALSDAMQWANSHTPEARA